MSHRNIRLLPALLGLSVMASGAAAATTGPDVKALWLIGAFVVGLVIFVWIASKVMRPEAPADDENPFLPIGIGDEEDREAGDR